MNLQDKIQADLKGAMRAKDEIRVSTIRFLMSAIHNAKIESEEVDDEDVVGIIQKQIKQRKESIEGFKKANRDELVEKESKGMEILQKYLPEQLSESDIENIVDKTIKDTSSSSVTDMGKVMGKLSSELKGKADMSVVSGMVRKKLA